METEGKETGKIAYLVYLEYMFHIGIKTTSSVLVLVAIARSLVFLSDWWIARWASKSEEEQKDARNIWILIVFAGSGALTYTTGAISLYVLLIKGSTSLHDLMIRRLLRAPLKFFHTNPTGRILNRFSKDLGLQDDELPLYALALYLVSPLPLFRVVLWFQDVLTIGLTLVLVAIALPFMLIFFVFMFFIFWRLRTRFVTCSREVKRFDGITRSPVYAMLSSNIKGLSVIRAFGSQSRLQDKFTEAMDFNTTWWAAYNYTSRWIGFRTDGLAALVVLFSVLLTLLIADDVMLERFVA